MVDSDANFALGQDKVFGAHLSIVNYFMASAEIAHKHSLSKHQMILLVDVLGEEGVCKELYQAFQVRIGFRVDGRHEIFDCRVAFERSMEHGAALILKVVGTRRETRCRLIENSIVKPAFDHFVQTESKLVYRFKDSVLLVQVLAALMD